MKKLLAALSLSLALTFPVLAQDVRTLGGSSGGGGTPGGTNGQIQYNNSGVFGGFTVSGDCGLVSSTGVITCTKINGTAVTPPASGLLVGTTDTQTLTGKSIAASEVNSGILAAAQAPGLGHPGYKSTIWYAPIGQLSNTSGGAPALTTAYCSIGAIGGNAAVSIVGMGSRMTTAGSSNFQLALYNDDATVSPHRPGTLVGSTPNIADTGTTSISAALTGGPFSVNPGFYWFCEQVADTTVRFLARISTSNDISTFIYAGSATLANALVAGTVAGGVSTTTGITSFGTWPANMNGSTWTEVGTTAPAMVFQIN